MKNRQSLKRLVLPTPLPTALSQPKKNTEPHQLRAEHGPTPGSFTGRLRDNVTGPKVCLLCTIMDNHFLIIKLRVYDSHTDPWGSPFLAQVRAQPHHWRNWLIIFLTEKATLQISPFTVRQRS